MAVGRKTGGRRKGVRNKATAAKAAAIAKSGLTPLDFMLGVMRDAKADPAMRLDAAKSAAPYVHPKLSSVQHSGAVGTYDLTGLPDEKLRELEGILGPLTVADGDPGGDRET